jgi:outer membrane receptor protein involved in Fe transport
MLFRPSPTGGFKPSALSIHARTHGMKAYSVPAVYRVAAALVLALFTFVGPVSAATSSVTTVAQAQPQATINGHVTGSSAAGLAGATVNLDGPARASTTTDASGDFTFTVPPGAYTINVNKGGYQAGTSDVLATSGAVVSVNVGLTEASLGNLQVIGRSSANSTGNAAKFNISSASTAQLTAAQIQIRNVPDVAKLVATLPGIIATTNSSSTNSFFRIHGLGQESLVTVDGHPISSGVAGTYLDQFTSSALIGSVDLLKGAGLNGPTSGEAGAGILNFRTPDFSPKDTAFVKGGLDQYFGSFYSFLANFNIGKFSFVLGDSFSGYRGNTFDQSAYGLVAPGGNNGSRIAPNFTSMAPTNLTNNLIAYSNDYSATQRLNSQLAKVRFKFSDATSIAFEAFALQAQWSPQGASYGQFNGFATIPQCLTKGVAANGAGCLPNSVYNSPFTTNAIGLSSVPLYTYFPGTQIQNSNPNFNLDFKTTFKNDTLLLRPYTATITRLLDGSAESSVYGNGPNQAAQGSFLVTSNANCQVQFINPTAAGGAKGPCYAGGAAAATPGFVNSTAGFPTIFPVTTAAGSVNCAVAPFCYTTETQQQNNGIWGFGSPMTQLEVDKLAGYTFTYIHPVANNIYSLSIDHYYNDTVSYQNDGSPLVPGCAFTQLGGVPVNANGTALNPADPALQPGCTLVGPGGNNTITYKPTQLAIPETFASVTAYSLTAQFQLSPKLEFDFGNYLTTYKIYGQQESPTFIASYVAAQQALGDTVNTNLAPIVLSGFVNSASHYDPHFGLVYRPTPNLVIRATGGSAITIPYASLVSGLQTVTQTTSSITITAPNPGLKPETTTSLDLGSDYRLKDGTVFSVDLFSDFVHNTWLTNVVAVPAPAGFAPNGVYFLSTTFNGWGRWSRGIEFNVANLPQLGFGYNLSFTYNRLNYLNEPDSYLTAAPTQTFNIIQDYGYPYDKGYLNLQYAWARNSLLRLGTDFEGNWNPANYKAYFLLDAGLAIGIGGGWQFLTTVENLNNFTFGAPLGHAVAFQGNVPPQVQIINGQYVYNNGASRGLVQPTPQTFRFSLSKRF